MRHLFALMLALLLALGILSSCAGTGVPNEGTGSQAPDSGSSAEEPVTQEPETEPPEPHPEESPVLLSTKDSQLSLSIRGGQLFVDGLTFLSSGRNAAGGTVPVSLPDSYKLPSEEEVEITTSNDPAGKEPDGDPIPFVWEYRGCERIRDNGSEGYAFSFSDAGTGSTYVISAIGDPELAGPFEFSAVFTSGLDRKICFVPGNYLSLDVRGESVPVVWSFKEEHCVAEGWEIFNHKKGAKGTGIYQTAMESGAAVRAFHTSNANSDKDYIPILYVQYAENDFGVYTALEWIHGAVEAASPEGQGEAVLSCELCGETGFTGKWLFATELSKDVPFSFPAVYLGVYEGDVDDGSNTFKDWFLHKKAPARILENENEPLIQEDMQIGLDAANYGIEAIKWDNGWWNPPDVRYILSEPNEGYMGVLRAFGAETIAEFTALAKERGLSLTLYTLFKDSKLEAEGVPTSVGPDGHPTWFADGSADFGNPDCVEFYKTYLLRFYRENGIQTMRTDGEPICYGSGWKNRHYVLGRDVGYWCAVGFYEIIDYLYENLPDFRYECCSNAGSMKDYATLSRSVILNCDDSADYMSLRMTFYDSSYCIHPAQLQLPMNSMTYYEGSQYYTGTADLLAGFRTQLMCGVMLSNWQGTSEIDRQLWETWLPVYKEKIRPLIREGNLYHILPRPDSVHWDGIQYIDPDSERENIGIVMLWKPSDEEGSTKTVLLRGLDPDATYELVFEDRPEQNRTATGAELMESGLPVTIEEPSGSEWIWIRRG